MFRLFLISAAAIGHAAQLVSAQPAPPTLTFVSSDRLPPVKIDGETALVHTQGLWVSDDHYYVTGRLERRPKRALLFRFDRHNRQRYEHIDVTPNSPSRSSEKLDHPGGFDFFDGYFWIPVAQSKPQGPSVIYRIKASPGQPLSQLKAEVAFIVEDHIGAIAYEPSTDLLYGASWDTKSIYIWNPRGELQRKIARAQLVKRNPRWQLAVQDWKHVPAGWFGSPAIIAGGIDKSPHRIAADSNAVIEFLDMKAGTSLAEIRMPPVEGVTRPITNEGLAWHHDELFLLPEDLGRGAKVLRYRLDRGR